MLPSSLYLLLREQGSVVLSCDEANESLIGGARRHAKRDGLQVTATRGSRKHLSRSQARTRPWHIALVDPADLSTIVRPDATPTDQEPDISIYGDETLLDAIIRLTHSIHSDDMREGGTLRARTAREAHTADLRGRRDLVKAEVLRRMAR